MSEYGLEKCKPANSCKMRWVARIGSLDGFLDAYETIAEKLEEMKLNTKSKWNQSTSGDASSYLNISTSFEFIVTLPITTRI